MSVSRRILSGALLTAALLIFIFSPGLLHTLFVVSKPLPRSDAIILLAGANQERAPEAARLYRQGVAPVVVLTNDGVFSGWSQKYQRNLYNIEWLAEILMAKGVSRSDIVYLPAMGSGTISDAVASRGYARTNGVRSLILVTSDYHTRRALWTFRSVFGNDPVIIGIIPVKSPCPGWLKWRGEACRRLATETVKTAYYLSRHYVCRNL